MRDGNIFYRYTLYNSLFYSNIDTLYKIFHHVQNTTSIRETNNFLRFEELKRIIGFQEVHTLPLPFSLNLRSSFKCVLWVFKKTIHGPYCD